MKEPSTPAKEGIITDLIGLQLKLDFQFNLTILSWRKRMLKFGRSKLFQSMRIRRRPTNSKDPRQRRGRFSFVQQTAQKSFRRTEWGWSRLKVWREKLWDLTPSSATTSPSISKQRRPKVWRATSAAAGPSLRNLLSSTTLKKIINNLKMRTSTAAASPIFQSSSMRFFHSLQ